MSALVRVFGQRRRDRPIALTNRALVAVLAAGVALCACQRRGAASPNGLPAPQNAQSAGQSRGPVAATASAPGARIALAATSREELVLPLRPPANWISERPALDVVSALPAPTELSENWGTEGPAGEDPARHCYSALYAREVDVDSALRAAVERAGFHLDPPTPLLLQMGSVGFEHENLMASTLGPRVDVCYNIAEAQRDAQTMAALRAIPLFASIAGLSDVLGEAPTSVRYSRGANIEIGSVKFTVEGDRLGVATTWLRAHGFVARGPGFRATPDAATVMVAGEPHRLFAESPPEFMIAATRCGLGWRASPDASQGSCGE